MKGIELPINILVVVAVAVIVLLGVIALYFSGFMGPAGLMSQEAAKQKYCAIIMRSPDGCAEGYGLQNVTVMDFDADKDGKLDSGKAWDWDTNDIDDCVADNTVDDNLASLLACYFGATSERNGLVSCGCAI